MSGTRQYMSANLGRTEAGKGKHWTKAEIESRKNSEVKGTAPERVTPPKYLSPAQKREFKKIAKQLIDLDVGFCEMDYDFLAMYLTSRDEYLAATVRVADQIENGVGKKDYDWLAGRNKLFSQCQACAKELGLTVSSRCKLVVPEKETEDEDPLAELRAKYQKRREMGA